MMNGVSTLRMVSRASQIKPEQDASSPNLAAAGTEVRAPLSSIPGESFNLVLGDPNRGDFSSPSRKAGSFSLRDRKKSIPAGEGDSYPHLENSDVSISPPASGTSRGTSKSHFNWNQRKHSSIAFRATSDAQGPGSASAQPVPVKSVSRALQYTLHRSPSTESGASASGRTPSSTTVNLRTPNVAKHGPPPPIAVNNSGQHFDLQEDPSFWKHHNVQVLIRTRPLTSSEIAAQGYARCLRQDSAHMITWTGPPESSFTFDHVACESITQEKLFRVAGLPMVDNCMVGYNSCMFAYGQTGSGKTHTMLGDIHNLDTCPSSNRGMTPRVFEYLFARISQEEKDRRNERLQYHCKCSFLEIHNEQITDLLEPTSNNLQMREDVKTGVYVEHLTEVEVVAVRDVIQLLLKGAANRKVASTSMNRESSRSHSVLTCVVESKWEYDSMTNTRCGRLNLVDLAGSERQKSSGAEGERLKEAANINKSLSTLGLVIMVLVDIANGKQRHVPYRDSKLTFLLQDSLGGNSKTTIIANVSPSSCCSIETMSTLKFAERAKFIQNNAVVNEDATADTIALRGEIQQLKDELNRVRRRGTSRCESFGSSIPLRETNGVDDSSLAIVGFNNGGAGLRRSVDSLWDSTTQRAISSEKAQRVESLLAGSFRRAQDAENTSKRLATEIEHLNRLVHHRDQDTQCKKMMLRFREDTIRRLEAVANGILSAEECLMEEKAALQKELHSPWTRIDLSPELTRFDMENTRLMEEVWRYQEFFVGMERETLLQEFRCLRHKLIEALEAKAIESISVTPSAPQDSQPSDDTSRRNAEGIMQVQPQLESYEAVAEGKDRQRSELEAKCTELQQEVFHLTGKLQRALNQSATSCKFEKTGDSEGIVPCPIGHCTISKGRAPEQTSMYRASSPEESRAQDPVAPTKQSEDIMHLQVQLESYEALLEERVALRNELDTKCSCINAQVHQGTVKLKDVQGELGFESSVNAPSLQSGLPDPAKNRAPGPRGFQTRAESSVEFDDVNAKPPRMDVYGIPRIFVSRQAHDETVCGLEREWKQERDQLLLEVHEARLPAKEKASESATPLRRCHAGQSILSELEQTTNPLVQASVTKTNPEREWNRERDGLLSELGEAKLLAHDSEAKVQNLKSIIESLHGHVKGKAQVNAGMQEEVLDIRFLDRMGAKEKDMEAATIGKNYEECQALLTDLQSSMNDLVSTNEKLMSDVQSLHVQRKRSRLVYEKYAGMEAKLVRTEELKRGLEYDISLLQESAAELSFKREEARELGVAVEILEQQLEIKCQELRETKVSMSKLEIIVYEKDKMFNSLSDELLDAKAELQRLRKSKVSTEVEQVQNSSSPLQI